MFVCVYIISVCVCVPRLPTYPTKQSRQSGCWSGTCRTNNLWILQSKWDHLYTNCTQLQQRHPTNGRTNRPSQTKKENKQIRWEGAGYHNKSEPGYGFSNNNHRQQAHFLSCRFKIWNKLMIQLYMIKQNIWFSYSHTTYTKIRQRYILTWGPACLPQQLSKIIKYANNYLLMLPTKLH